MSSSRFSATRFASGLTRAVAEPHEQRGGNQAQVSVLEQSAAHAPASAHVAYLINQYPKVSHSFIRREILELERRGFCIHRFAVRGWDAELVDPEDHAELARTRFLLKGGILQLALAMLITLTSRPSGFLAGLKMSLRRARRSDRSLPYHLAYLAQACLLLRWLQATPVTHLHAHFGTNSTDIAMLVRLLGGPSYSFTAHGTEEIDRGVVLGLEDKVAHAAFVVAISDFTRSQLYRYVSASHWSKVGVVHCGLEEAFHAGSQPAVSSPDRLVCVGRISEEKGHLILIEALARIVGSGRRCNLVLVGDGELRPLVEARARELGISAHVTITGWVSSARVRDEIQAARALILPSFLEGLPIVLMEAMFLRRPVIASGVAGIPELVNAGNVGWLVPPGNVTELARAITECIDMPNEDLRRMADAAYDRVAERHSIAREAAKLALLLSGKGSALGIADWGQGNVAPSRSTSAAKHIA